MVDPINGGYYQKIQAQQEVDPAQYKKEMEEADTKQVKLDPKKDSIALAFVRIWGWPANKALLAQKQYIKNILHDCGHILDRYKHIFKKLREQNEDS